MIPKRFVRRILLPTVWVVIGAVIATSLAVLAFGGGTRGDGDTLTPTATAQSETVAVERGAVTNSLDVSGTIVVDPPVDVTSPGTGTLAYAWVRSGTKVDKGAPLLQVKVTEIPETSSDAEDEDAEPAEPVVRYVTVYAPAAGRVTALTAVVGDEVTEDATLAKIRRTTYTARGSISPLDRYRLLDLPDEATVAIEGGPEPFPCDDLRIADTATAESTDPETGETSGGAGISCRVPNDVKVFDGLAMTMTIDSGSVEDVLLIPVTAVRGLVDSGTVWIAGDGEPAAREITVGTTDGKVIQVRKGLKEGDQVLRYVPGSSAVEAGMTGEEYVE